MNPNGTIRARVGLPCEIRFHDSRLGSARGITEELSRDVIVVVVFPSIPFARLNRVTHLSVSIELPHSGVVPPRMLQCSAMVCDMRLVQTGLRVQAAVNAMSIQERMDGQYYFVQ